ncbi:Holliday junction DNA helicase RuvA [Desulfohalotomaculum tongense]|uniref:Holliday junction branch migration protein RuvA n=1 Tax=Desulforadius tongensis TaxID=1216062 RepID=UPI001956600F|nr:Holliday junction branch migration protein RuvA [Desulforadius tongensis]MBM7855115.1 Holliday junction DNA helicase RuvA [Desulforadius tongensis]
MIAFLRGKLAAESTGKVVLDVNGVGYQLLVSSATLADMPPVGEEVFLHTHMVVREDSMQLYGFKTEEELFIFTAVLGVSGVGPKGALSLLSTYQPGSIREIMANEDVTALTKVSGIGKKTAQRLILELKDKLGSIPAAAKKTAPNIKHQGSMHRDAEFALMALGYSQSEAAEAVKLACADSSNPPDVSALVKSALKYLMKEQR